MGKETAQRPNDVKTLYEKAKAYVALKQQELRQNNLVMVDDAFDLAEEMVETILVSDALNTQAINYYDPNDISISHSVNVTVFALTLAKGLNYSHKSLVDLCVTGLLHDVGVGKTPHELIHKDTDLLTIEDLEILKEHPLNGYEAILRFNADLKPIAEVVLQHHERCDGSGYPNQLTEDQMHPEACIISMIDVYEALIHPRSHRDALIPPKGLQEIIKQKGTSFSLKLVKALIEHISIYPVGCYVKLNTGEIAKVIKTKKENPVRPVVEIQYDDKGNRITPKIIDLGDDYLFNIVRCVPHLW